MAFVLDCSVTMAWVFPDEASESTDALRDSLIQESAIVPALWPIEVANVLLVAARRGRISEDDWPRICSGLEVLPIDIEPDSRGRVLHTVLPMARQHQLSVYDTMYLELAIRHRLPLATLDQKLMVAARKAGVEIVGS